MMKRQTLTHAPKNVISFKFNLMKIFWQNLFWIFVALKKAETRICLSIDNKKILENWLKSNSTNSYANSIEIVQLSLKTDLPESRIKKWLHNKRSRSKTVLINGTKPNKCFTKQDKLLLKTFYDTKTTKPGPNDLSMLAECIQKKENRIKRWFYNENSRINRISAIKS